MTRELSCSFCQKTEHQVRKLVAGGGGGTICDECVAIAARIMQDSDAPPKRSAWRRVLSRLRRLTLHASRSAQARIRSRAIAA